MNAKHESKRRIRPYYPANRSCCPMSNVGSARDLRRRAVHCDVVEDVGGLRELRGRERRIHRTRTVSTPSGHRGFTTKTPQDHQAFTMNQPADHHDFATKSPWIHRKNAVDLRSRSARRTRIRNTAICSWRDEQTWNGTSLDGILWARRWAPRRSRRVR